MAQIKTATINTLKTLGFAETTREALVGLISNFRRAKGLSYYIGNRAWWSTIKDEAQKVNKDFDDAILGEFVKQKI